MQAETTQCDMQDGAAPMLEGIPDFTRKGSTGGEGPCCLHRVWGSPRWGGGGSQGGSGPQFEQRVEPPKACRKRGDGPHWGLLPAPGYWPDASSVSSHLSPRKAGGAEGGDEDLPGATPAPASISPANLTPRKGPGAPQKMLFPVPGPGLWIPTLAWGPQELGDSDGAAQEGGQRGNGV